MPELPEVESVCVSLLPHLAGRSITELVVHNPGLRWPVQADIVSLATGLCVDRVERRAKYILFRGKSGSLIWHLGMSGSLRLAKGEERRKHDHVEVLLNDGQLLRFHDPRRFGSLHWGGDDPAQHPLLAALGVEPLGANFSSAYLWERIRHSARPIKTILLDSKVVVGIGNIYASEILFQAGVHPLRLGSSIKKAECAAICTAVVAVLAKAISIGGTTLRDYVDGNGDPGGFQEFLAVYGRENLACRICKYPIVKCIIGQRSSFYCPKCQ